MQSLKIVGEFLARPYEAFKAHKGKYMGLSIVLGLLLHSPLLLWAPALMDNSWHGVLLVAVVAAANVFVTVALLHGISAMFGGEGSWRELLSVYGFTTLPNLLPALVTVTTLVFNVPRYRMDGSPQILSILTPGVMPMVYFQGAMTIAAYIYSGLAISSVYKLKWTKVVGCVVVSIIAGSFISGAVSSSIPLWNLPWQTTALMLENVEELHLGFSANTTAFVQTPSFSKGELVLVQLRDTIYLRTSDSANSYFRNGVLGELVGVPGDIVALESGTLIVNGVVQSAPPYPLPHLSLAETTLDKDNYLIYFTSPALLGTETRPELFIINSKQVRKAVPLKSLSFLRWTTR